MSLPHDAAARKQVPIYSGFIKYFPRAIVKVAELSKIGNDQHNPGAELFWDRSKSGDERDAQMRHIVDEAMGVRYDVDGVLHATKTAWRAMAALEKLLERIDADIPAPKKIWEVEGEGEPEGGWSKFPSTPAQPGDIIGAANIYPFDWGGSTESHNPPEPRTYPMDSCAECARIQNQVNTNIDKAWADFFRDHP